MSSGIFFCKRPQTLFVCSQEQKQSGERRERQSSFLVSLEKCQRQCRRRRGGGEWLEVVVETDNRPPYTPSTSPFSCPLRVVGSGDDERGGDAAQHQVPAGGALGRMRRREEVSLSAGLLGQPGLCWVPLLESSQQIKHHNTHPSPKQGHTHGAGPRPLSLRMCQKTNADGVACVLKRHQVDFLP